MRSTCLALLALLVTLFSPSLAAAVQLRIVSPPPGRQVLAADVVEVSGVPGTVVTVLLDEVELATLELDEEGDAQVNVEFPSQPFRLEVHDASDSTVRTSHYVIPVESLNASSPVYFDSRPGGYGYISILLGGSYASVMYWVWFFSLYSSHGASTPDDPALERSGYFALASFHAGFLALAPVVGIELASHFGREHDGSFLAAVAAGWLVGFAGLALVTDHWKSTGDDSSIKTLPATLALSVFTSGLAWYLTAEPIPIYPPATPTEGR